MATSPAKEVLIHNIWRDVHVFKAVRHNGTVAIADNVQFALGLHPTNPHASARIAWGVTLYYGEEKNMPTHAKSLETFERELDFRDVPKDWYPNLYELCAQSHEGNVPLWPAISAGITQHCPLDIVGLTHGLVRYRFKVGRRVFKYTQDNAFCSPDIETKVRSLR